MSRKILIVEDEPRTAGWVKIYLERAGFIAETARDGMEGLNLARTSEPDLILLDILMPRLNGVELCRMIRKESDVPIIMTTSRGAKEDRLRGLDEGADDYLVKPFDPDELVARINALLRRTGGSLKKSIRCGPLELDEEKRSVRLYGEVLPLSQAQYLLLTAFMKNPGRVFSREQLIDGAFKGNFESYDRAIDTHIKRLRKIINRKDFQPIETVYGAGYRFSWQ